MLANRGVHRLRLAEQAVEVVAHCRVNREFAAAFPDRQVAMHQLFEVGRELLARHPGHCPGDSFLSWAKENSLKSGYIYTESEDAEPAQKGDLSRRKLVLVSLQHPAETA